MHDRWVGKDRKRCSARRTEQWRARGVYAARSNSLGISLQLTPGQHFEAAAKRNRVLISNDQDMEVIANAWLKEGRAFRGLILWPQEHYKRMSYGELVSRIEALSEPFPQPVIHLSPRD